MKRRAGLITLRLAGDARSAYTSAIRSFAHPLIYLSRTEGKDDDDERKHLLRTARRFKMRGRKRV